MQALQNRDRLSSDINAMDQLQDFLRQCREAHEPVEHLDAFEQELHRLFVTAEREALSQELSRFDWLFRVSLRRANDVEKRSEGDESVGNLTS